MFFPPHPFAAATKLWPWRPPTRQEHGFSFVSGCHYICVCVCVCRIFEKTYKKSGRRTTKKRQQTNFECACQRVRAWQRGWNKAGVRVRGVEREERRVRGSGSTRAKRIQQIKLILCWGMRPSDDIVAAENGGDAVSSYKWPAGSEAPSLSLSLSPSWSKVTMACPLYVCMRVCVNMCWYFFCAFIAATVAVSVCVCVSICVCVSTFASASAWCLCRGLASRFSPFLCARFAAL